MEVLFCTSCILGFFSVDESVGPPLSGDFSDIIVDACHATVAAGLGLRDRKRSAANAKSLGLSNIPSSASTRWYSPSLVPRLFVFRRHMFLKFLLSLKLGSALRYVAAIDCLVIRLAGLAFGVGGGILCRRHICGVWAGRASNSQSSGRLQTNVEWK